MCDEMLAWCQADGSNGSSPQGPLATLPCRLVSRGGRFETNTWIVPAGPLEGVGRRLIGPGARRQLATSLPDFYEWPEGLRGAVRVREAKWVEYVGGKIEDRIARKAWASDPASRVVFREESCSYACRLVIIC
jgi:hypothetical protein